MPEIHSKLSPSAAQRWFACPGSVALSEGMPEKTSPYAQEGTEAHALAESWLNGHTTLIPKAFAPLEIYIEHIQGLNATATKLHVEVQVKATEHCWGTADAIVWDPATATLYVRDLKYGSGVGVEVSDNLQLKIYALAALLTMKYPARTVNVGIVQPRFNHSDGPCRSKDYDAMDLLDFHADLLEAEKRVELASIATNEGRKHPTWAATYLNPTEKGCRFCLAAPKCPALKMLSQNVAKIAFMNEMPYDPKDLTVALDLFPILEGYIKNVREFAYAEAEKGIGIPDYKLVEKRATRKWRDEAFAAAKLFDAGLGDACYSEPELLTPAAIEKLLPKDQRAILDELTVKESSGHTLVHESDKREAVKLDAKSVFAD